MALSAGKRLQPGAHRIGARCAPPGRVPSRSPAAWRAIRAAVRRIREGRARSPDALRGCPVKGRSARQQHRHAEDGAKLFRLGPGPPAHLPPLRRTTTPTRAASRAGEAHRFPPARSPRDLYSLRTTRQKPPCESPGVQPRPSRRSTPATGRISPPRPTSPRTVIRRTGRSWTVEQGGKAAGRLMAQPAGRRPSHSQTRRRFRTANPPRRSKTASSRARRR